MIIAPTGGIIDQVNFDQVSFPGLDSALVADAVVVNEGGNDILRVFVSEDIERIPIPDHVWDNIGNWR